MNNKYIYKINIIPYSILIFVVIVSFFAFFWMISTSLMTLGETINRSILPENPQWINYATTWNEGKFSKYLLNSILITLVTVIGLLITSILSAYAFAKIDFPGMAREWRGMVGNGPVCRYIFQISQIFPIYPRYIP